MSTPERWWSVSFVVDEADARPLSRQEIFDIMHVRGVRRLYVGPSAIGEPEEVASLRLELQASDAEAAKERAETLILRGRRAASLPDAVPSIAWVTPLTDEDSSSARFLEKAEELLDDEDEADMAVAAAQIHLEVQIRTLLEHAAERDGPGWLEVLMSQRGLGNLNNKQTEALVRELLGLEIRQTPEWPEYRKHIVRRNAIIHEGRDVQQEEATASVAVIRALSIRLADSAMQKGISSRRGE